MSLNESGKFTTQKKKLQGICDEHNLVFSFSGKTYPTTLVIKTTGDVSGQMSMLEEAEDDGYRSPDAKLVFSIKDGELDYGVMGGAFRISDNLISKIKTIYKKMHYFWLQYYHRELVINDVVSANDMPTFDDEDDEDGDIVTEVFDDISDDVDLIEDFDDEDDD